MARFIFNKTAHREEHPEKGLGTAIARLFAECGLDEDIAELRGYTVEPPTFEREDEAGTDSAKPPVPTSD